MFYLWKCSFLDFPRILKKKIIARSTHKSTSVGTVCHATIWLTVLGSFRSRWASTTFRARIRRGVASRWGVRPPVFQRFQAQLSIWKLCRLKCRSLGRRLCSARTRRRSLKSPALTARRQLWRKTSGWSRSALPALSTARRRGPMSAGQRARWLRVQTHNAGKFMYDQLLGVHTLKLNWFYGKWTNYLFCIAEHFTVSLRIKCK